MELRGQAPVPVAPAVADGPLPPVRCATRAPLRAGEVQLYRVCEELTQWLIYAMVVFSPWAFGTTQPWSIWTMNAVGYALGLLLAVKLVLRWGRGYRPPRWAEWRTPSSAKRSPTWRSGDRARVGQRRIAALACTTLAVLVYVLLSALNARATARFLDATLTFEYHDCIAWLPHSLDSVSTWNAFWTYLGLACTFWAVRDWLLGKSEDEERAHWQKSAGPGVGVTSALPQRLRRLLWLLAINGAVLGLEAIAQRLDQSPKLLFLVQPRIHKTAEGQFGPYAYRSNAAQYFNLLWPVCVGFWWALDRKAGSRRTHHLLLAAAAILAACPIISTSRAGAVVTLAIAALAGFFLLAMHFMFGADRRKGRRARALPLAPLGACFTAALVLGLSLGWSSLAPRLGQVHDGFEGRQLMYEAARPMARDYPWFGTGAGTFESVSYLYPRPDIYWPPQLHNDWLETRITFGWVGSALIAFAFLMVIARWFAGGGIHGSRQFGILCWLALAGCLAHARYDFPLQVHSVLLLFLLICAILSTLSRSAAA